MAAYDYWPQGPPSGRPSGPRYPGASMRVSDAERTEVTDALIRHAAEGRLDEEEYQARVAKATAAKTRGDLWPLMADLPPLGAPPATPPRRRRTPSALALVVLAWISLWWVGLAVGGIFWHFLRLPVIVLVVVALVLLRRHRRGARRRWCGPWY
jgi:Flp pilus assembly protein TadB